MTEALDDLVGLLDLEPIEVNIFRGAQPDPDERRQRVFGGQVAGQALVAAARTVETDRAVHSLHAYFLRPGDTSVPILYEVDRIRDGKSFTTRRVVAIQHGKPIFNLQASFQCGEQGLDHQQPMPDVPDPGTLQTVIPERISPIDLRHVEPPFWHAPDQPERDYQRVWFRTAGPLADDPVLHACVVTYVSDLTLLDTTLLPHRRSSADQVMQMASLDHAMWFHRPFRADDWLLYDQATPSASSARGLARGSIFTRDGQLAVSVVQEGLIRTRA
ncbi:MAG TPA: acyl-CoA thioesterase II, partial [Acidimicrobiales bacterium]|nr:acyl-CoA thioesterase II [Acidimicrobiales bacterium]